MGILEWARTLYGSGNIGDRLMAGKPVPIEIRLEKHSIPEPNTGCFFWLGATINSRRGEQYGVIGTRNDERFSRLMELVHRVAYVLHTGNTIPKGLHIDHVCMNTLCVNPEHLECVTTKEHRARTYFRRYGNACQRGHPFDEANTWIEKNGARHCRRCHADNQTRRNRAARLNCESA